MRRLYSLSVLLVLCALMFQGCRTLNPSIMLKTGKDYKFDTFPPTQIIEYKIAPNDQLSFQIFSNDGAKIIDNTMISEGSVNQAIIQGAISYKVEFDGTVKMPLLGHVSLQGMTVRQAETFLEEKFTKFYNKPFVLLEVTNRKVTVFPGSEGSARVVPLRNENTTLFEAMAEAGGIANTGKAYRVKLIRGDLKNPQIYLIDLSTVEGVKQADLVLQANDIIYVEPTIHVANEVMGSVLPYLSFVTTVILFVEFFSKRGTP